jgi:AsmA protein
MKKILTIVGIVVALLIAIAIALPLLVNVNQFKPTLEAKLSAALGRKVDVGNIELSILSGGVKVDDVAIADDPAFSTSPFLQAKRLTAGVALLPLIFSKKLEVSSFKVTQPQVSLLRSPSGKWNYSSLGAGASKTGTKSDASAPADFSVETLAIENGTILVGTVGAKGKTTTYQNVDFEASDLSFTSQFPFKLSVKAPGGGNIKVEGKAGPIDSADASLTPVDAKVDVKGLDLAATGFVSGIAGVMDFGGDLGSDGHQMTSKGTVKAEKIKLVAAGSPSAVPVNVDYDTSYDLKSQKGTLRQGDIHVGKALLHLTGAYDTSGATAAVQMKLSGQNMPVTDLVGVLPAVGVALPSGASLQQGSLTLNLAINGPLDKPVIAGPVNLSNAKLAGYSLKSKLGALSSFGGLGGGGGGSDTDIQSLTTDLRVDADGTHANNLVVVLPSIGTVAGNANVSPTNQLNCKMSAKLAGGASVATSALTAFGGGGKSQGSGGIPFTITGTTSNPVFVPDVAGMAGGMVSGIAGAPAGVTKGLGGASSGAGQAATGALGGLFGKKK